MSRIKNVLTKLMEKLAPLAPEEYDDESVAYTKHATGVTIRHSATPRMVTLWAYVDRETFRWKWEPGRGAEVMQAISAMVKDHGTALTWGHAATLNREIRKIENRNKK